MIVNNGAMTALTEKLQARSPSIHFQFPTVSAAVTESVKYVKRVGEHCDPRFFYHTYRFFLNGWGTDGEILPDGIEFEERLH